MANRDMTSVVYTDDKGNDYLTKVDKSVFLQTTGDPAVPVIGGRDMVAADGNLPNIPAGLRRRTAIVSYLGNLRRVVCLTADAPLYTTPGTNVTLPVLGGAAVAYAREDTKAESWKRRPRSSD
jgi:hypothetical protein